MTDKPLTERQQAVLDLLKTGKNPTEIGSELGISSQGVHGHLRRLRKRGLVPGEPLEAAAPDANDIVTADSAFDAVRQAAAQEKAKLARSNETIDATIDRLQQEIKDRRAMRKQNEQAIQRLDSLSV